MAKRNKLKAPKEQPVRREIVHDRLTSDLPRNIRVATVEVDCPINKGDRLLVFQNIREDVLAWLLAHKAIDDAQFNAGRHLQRAYQEAGISVRGFDFSKEAVDGGAMAETLTEQSQQAIQEIIRLERILGLEGAALARDLLWEGHSLKECAEDRQMFSDRLSRYIRVRFREILETLAVELGFASR